MIVNSDAGTGKNFKVNILGHLTNREVFHVSCNAGMEKADILYSQEINAEGTFRSPSELIR
ncbi:MAG: AAA family ATPase [Candidatus Peribacteria bacterium]|nr:MAG: AAA family ATPase [Candidatus Peribacteria bacterium]